jgi:hypothetical protein
MSRKLCDVFGRKGQNGMSAFPTPRDLLSISERDLRTQARVGYRAPYIQELAETAADLSHWLNNPNEMDIGKFDLHKEINSWKGFGTYATSHLLVLMGDHRQLPIDREVAAFLGVDYRKVAEKRSNKFYSDWGDFKFTAYRLERIHARQT